LPPPEPAPTERTAGVVVLAFADARMLDTHLDRLAVTAAFGRGQGIGLRTLEAVLAQPDPALPLAPDSCALLESAEGPRPDPGATIALLDVGTMSLEAFAGSFSVPAAAVPDLLPGVSGVRYEAAFERARALLVPGRLRVRTTGGSAVGPLEASVSVPRPVRIAFVGGVPMRDAGATVEPGRPFEVRWGSVEGRSTVRVELSALQRPAGPVIRCSWVDDGNQVLPEPLLASLPPRAATSPWRLTLRRSAEAPMQGAGLDEGSLSLVISDSVTLY
jgi:hypothetical protein